MTHDELIQMKKGYIDVHCHVIPHIDDGARTTSQALRMIGIAYKNGIRTMVATPHYEVSRYDNNIEKIIKYYNKVKMLAKEKYPDFNIFLGNEVFYSYGVIDGLHEKRIFTLGETDYVLVEFSPNDSLEHIEKSLYELINGGYRPILAHVERYENVIKNHRNTERLVEMGVYIQTNVSTLAGKSGHRIRGKVLKLIKRDLIHFIGTDAHSDGRRAPEAEKGLEYVLKKTDEETAYRLFRDNALKMLNNEYLEED